MPKTPEALRERILEFISPGARNRLQARGLARGLIWRNGRLPEGSPRFSEQLTEDLLSHAYSLLLTSLELREFREHEAIWRLGLNAASEAIESAYRRGDREDPERGFHLVVAAAACHLARAAARSFCLCPTGEADNLSTIERLLVLLMRRELKSLERACRAIVNATDYSDEGVLQRMLAADSDADELLINAAFTKAFARALGLFCNALLTGDSALVGESRELLLHGVDTASEVRSVETWWVYYLALHLLDDMWGQSLHVRLPLAPSPDGADGGESLWNNLREDFIQFLACRNYAEVDLWPSQIEVAARVLDSSDNLVVSLPTSAGKTRAAELCILRALSAGKRVVYITPLRALSAQLERTLGDVFRPLGFSVSSLYGASGVTVADVEPLQSDSIVVATPEKLDFAIRQTPAILDDVGLVVLDEGHMIGLGVREIRYEALVQRLLRRGDAASRRIVCLSAVLGQGPAFEEFCGWMRMDQPGGPVESKWRPTRQRFAVLEWADQNGKLKLKFDEDPFVPSYVVSEPPAGRRRTPFPKGHVPQELTLATAKAMLRDGHTVLIYCPERRSVESLATVAALLAQQGHFSSLLHDAGQVQYAQKLGAEWLGTDHPAVLALSLGIAVHHGALPRPFLAELERLLTNKTLRLTIASPTLAQGLNLSCSALILHSLFRNGEFIPAEEFGNVIGRAGRAYVDVEGLVVHPISGSDFVRRRSERNFYGLVSAAQKRSLESGIFTLIQQIAHRLQSIPGVTVNSLAEYVLNNAAEPWEAEIKDAEDASHEERWIELLASLDVAILAVADLDCDVSAIAQTLDECLQCSLWQRRLTREDEAVRRIHLAVLTSRAAYIWSSTSPGQRRGYFLAGIGLQSGRRLDDQLAALSQDLLTAEFALQNGHPSQAIPRIIAVADRLMAIHPFKPHKPEDVPASWHGVLTDWILGTPMREIVRRHGKKSIGFIQDVVVFRLVWGCEAVRVHASATGQHSHEGSRGLVPAVLTYGVPTGECAMLMQAGLESREAACEALNLIPAAFSTKPAMANWLYYARQQSEENPDWPTGSSAPIWRAFASRHFAQYEQKWHRTHQVLEVQWHEDVEQAPPPGTWVRMVRDEGGAPMVCTADLREVGRLSMEVTSDRGMVDGKVREDGSSIELQQFGPSPAPLF